MGQGLRDGPVVVDLRALQAPAWRGTEVSSYLRDFAVALGRHRPDLVSRYLLAPDSPHPTDMGELLSTGKVALHGAPGAIPASARVYHSLSVFELDDPIGAVWPAAVEHLGLSFSATVCDLAPLKNPDLYLPDPRQRRRYRARCQVLRFADALLAVSEATQADLIDLVGVDPGAVTVVGTGSPGGSAEPDLWRTGTGIGIGIGIGIGTKESWQDVVDRAAMVFEGLATRHRRAWRRAPRLAFVSPFPPVASGIASYSLRLLEATTNRLAEIAPEAVLDCFADGLERAAPSVAPLVACPDLPGDGGWFDARSFPSVDRAIGGYDRIVDVLGNSEYHCGALAALRDRRGVVMAHEVRLTSLMRLSANARGAMPGGLTAAIRRAYGDAVPSLPGDQDSVSDADLERLGYLLLRDVAIDADQVLLSSEAARRLAAADVGPELSSRLSVLPFAMALEDAELAAINATRASLGRRVASDCPLIVSFGIVDPVKLPRVLVEAAAAMSDRREVHLALVGPISSKLATELTELVDELEIAGRVTLTGHVDRSAYLEYLGMATVAVQLRAGFGGEASAAVGDCLAAGVPTIVSNVGWLGELPDAVVVKLDRTSPASAKAELGDKLLSLLDHPETMTKLSTSAAAYAAEHTFARTAAALLDALDLAVAARK